jgi:hypothetical protein
VNQGPGQVRGDDSEEDVAHDDRQIRAHASRMSAELEFRNRPIGRGARRRR